MISVGILGGTGYTGKILLKFCADHINVKEVTVYGFSTAGESLLSIFPELQNQVIDSTIQSIKNISFEHDVYFIALPHGEALEYVPELIAKGKKSN